MFFTFWLVIWPNQKKVSANARNVQAGGEADPAAAPAAREAVLASRVNMIYLLPLLIFMVGPSHFPYDFFLTTGSSRGIFWVIWIVIWGVLELNALGLIGGTAPGGPRIIYDSHRNAIITSFVYSLGTTVRFSYVLKPQDEH